MERLRAARRGGDSAAVQEILAELCAVHVDLGLRRVGTSEEQNTYLLARTTRTPLPELLAVGIDTNQWPAPPNSTPSAVEPTPASPDTERRIAGLFHAAGPLADRRATQQRYTAEYRPEDGQRHHGELLPWAIWNNHHGYAIAYHSDRDLTEYQAEQATRAYEQRKKAS